MLYYFIMCRIKIKFSYLILLYHYRHGINLTIQEMQKKWLTPQFIGFLCVIMVNTHETHQLLIAALFSIDSNWPEAYKKGAVEEGTNIMSGPDSGGQVFKIVKKRANIW
jgi:hypothetical protein